MKATGFTIKALFIKRALSQKRVAELLGTSIPTVSRWINDERTPSIADAQRIAQITRSTAIPFNGKWSFILSNARTKR